MTIETITLVIGILIGIASSIVVLALFTGFSKRKEPTPEDDYNDRDYEIWKAKKQADARRNRIAQDFQDTSFPDNRKN